MDILDITDKILPVLAILLVSMIVGAIIVWLVRFLDKMFLPSGSKIKDGFVQPRGIEIKCEDVDLDGKYETFLVINKLRYSLKKSPEGAAYLEMFDIKLVPVGTEQIKT